ncbi:DNA polymerase III subunit delta [Arsenicitalea aurantiaca]|uniref:DNA-directed DNA polymerase n=1 Tax=Arsenicitalea aurantiaca TaxID=1783274 RepID=A0A433X7W5_9HYPH|nr:DNA polymerase III subunit delta [Arsenicitalea aurantiaca]RUT30140.1 DNA polymerase III subunit delta [Arsenicitalea aurantiaca]
MTALKAHEVARYLARPDLDEGIFLAYGPDAGLVRETAQRLVRHFARDDANASIVTLDGSEIDADPGRLAVEAKTPSLFGEKRVIRVRGAAKSLVMTLSELKDDPAGAAIILEGGNLLPRDPLRSLVEAAKLGRALPCYPDSDETLLALIRDTFSKEGIRFDPDVPALLRDSLGNDREITRRELEKLVLFAASSKTITREDVLTLCADNGAMILDQILDATGTGHAERLDDALARALAANINPQQLFATALMHFVQLRRWRQEMDQGRSARDVLENSRPRPHFSRKTLLEQQLRAWSEPALAAAGARLLAAIGDSRRKPALAETLLHRTLLALAREANGR